MGFKGSAEYEALKTVSELRYELSKELKNCRYVRALDFICDNYRNLLEISQERLRLLTGENHD